MNIVDDAGCKPRRALPALLVALGCCAAMLAGTAVSADAASRTIALNCLALAHFDFAPALNFNSTPTSFSGLASSCVSPNGKHKSLHSAVVFGTDGVTGKGCSPLLLQITGGNNTLYWNDGTTSKFRIQISTDPSTGKLGFNGYLTEGTLAGAKISGLPLLIAQKGMCLLGGVRGFTIEGTVTFTR